GRLRESGLIVYGFGERKTPEPFVAACDKFVYVENLAGKPDEPTPEKPRTAAQLKQDSCFSWAAVRGFSGVGSSGFPARFSTYTNLSHAATNGSGVLRSPKPYTINPDSRSRPASRVKSLSLETMQKPSKRPEYSRSIASMISA